MTSIVLPPLPMPYPARVNPHHAHARAAAKRWAFDIGILGSDESVWDEAAYEANDFAKFAAYGFPNASAEELVLLTEWYIFGWFVDDHFERLAMSSDDTSGNPTERALRLRVFTPVEPDAVPPEPEGAVERGMADLWPRTVPGTSPGWRRRFLAGFYGAIETSIGLLEFPEDDVLDPMEYVDLRRKDGGLFWTAKLVEHSVRAEVPERLASLRPLSVIETSFADVVGLRNDLFSYARDIRAGSSFNVVPVLAEGFGRSHQEAADLVGDLLTGRMNQLEDTVRDELPCLTMDEPERQSIAAYVQALRDHMAGDLRWHRETSRYDTDDAPAPPPEEGPRAPSPHGDAKQTGAPSTERSGPLRTDRSEARAAERGETRPAERSGARAAERGEGLRAHGGGALGGERGEALQAHRGGALGGERGGGLRAHRGRGLGVERGAGRPLAMPYEMRRSPHHEASGRRSTEWARRMGLLHPNGVPGSGAWTERQFTSENLGYIASTMYPDAPPARLELVSQWLVFVLYMDDLVVELFKRGRPLGPPDLAAADTLFARLPHFMPASRDTPVTPPVNVLERCLADLWPRSADLFPGRVDGLREHCAGHLWEIFNLHQHRIPEPLDYFDWRRHSFADALNTAYIRNSANIRLHPALTASRQLRALESAATDTMLLFNDVFSAHKEVELERCLSTATLPMERLLGCSRAHAIRTLNDLADARLRRFDHIATTQLPALTAKLDLGTDALETLDRYVDALRAWLAAVHFWHHAGDRYSASTAPSPRPALGTSATRPAAALAARTLRHSLTKTPPPTIATVHASHTSTLTGPSMNTPPGKAPVPSRPTVGSTADTVADAGGASDLSRASGVSIAADVGTSSGVCDAPHVGRAPGRSATPDVTGAPGVEGGVFGER